MKQERNTPHDKQTIAALTAELDAVRQQLAQANSDLEHLTYIASHDLQEPLRQIHILAAQLAAGENDPDVVRKQLVNIGSSAARMNALIGNVLEYARLSKGTPAFVPVDLNAVLAGTLTEFASVIAEKAVVIEADKLPVVAGVPQQLELLFRNLVGNALRFSGAAPKISIGTIKITPEICKRADIAGAPEDYVAIRVKDNGIGFDPSYATDIFRFFFRLEHPANTEGNGIGLALCRKIVDNHGGYIEAISEPGKGAEFVVVLPTKKRKLKV